MRLFITFFCIHFIFFFGHSQQIAKPVFNNFYIKNATLHTVIDGTFVGDVYIENGQIAQIGHLSPYANSELIDGTGLHVYPGFIDGGCRLGLAEIESIDVSNDFDEIGDFIPQMKALTAINPNSVSIPITRVNGVTTVFSKPQGGLFPGTGAMIDLFGYTPEQMYAGAEGLILQFPQTGRKGRFDKRTPEEIKKDSEKALKKLNDIWENGQKYAQLDSIARQQGKVIDGYNPQMQALLPAIKGEATLFIEVNVKEDILTALKWVAEHHIKAVFTGVSEGYRVLDSLAKSKIPVITGPILAIPGREIDRYDAAYTNASKMMKAGIKVAIRTNEAENVRNLPFNAGFAAAYGAGAEAALKAITLTPAEIFGISEHYGSLSKGKVANLFICDGDPFEPKTQIKYLFIRGWKIPLESRQTLLNDEFLSRTPGLKK